MQTKKQAVKKQQTKPAAKPVKKPVKPVTKKAPAYVVINVRLKPELKAQMAKIAKKRKLPLSKAVEQLIAAEVAFDKVAGDDVPVLRGPRKVTRDPSDSITISGAGPEVYQSAQWMSRGQPVKPPRLLDRVARFLNRLFG